MPRKKATTFDELYPMTKAAASGERIVINANQYRRIAIVTQGDLPQPCYFCSEMVCSWGGEAVVHHLDHDRLNNLPKNLVYAHTLCHTTYHHSLPTAKKAASKRAKMRWNDPDQRSRMQSAIKKARGTPESRKRTSRATTEAWKDPDRAARTREGQRDAWANLTEEERSARVERARQGILANTEDRERRRRTAQEVNARRVECPNGCGMVSNPGGIATHVRKGKCPLPAPEV